MSSHCNLFVVVGVLGLLLTVVHSRKHHLELKNDSRKNFALSTFGFYKNGRLDVNLQKFKFHPFDNRKVFGFSLDKTINGAIAPYLESHQDKCILEDKIRNDDTMSVMFFILDLKHKMLRINCSSHLERIRIYLNESMYNIGERAERNAKQDGFSDSFLYRRRNRRMVPENTPVSEDKKAGSRDLVAEAGNATVATAAPFRVEAEKVDMPFSPYMCNTMKIPLTETKDADDEKSYSVSFIVSIDRPEEEGLYNLYFHNCPNYITPAIVTSFEELNAMSTYVNLTIAITENNDGNYLSAGEMPLPALYMTMSLLFFLSGIFWTFILRKSEKGDVFKIHYLMAVLVFVKSSALLFHGINFHFIQIDGSHIEGWAVLYYITHLLKGALLFITIVLIGTGWAFIKNILSDKDKKIFMIVIPLQVLANVANIITEESEEADIAHATWGQVFILVDLLCCGAILFPVVWSIRHLQEASQTDGKAATNLRKLKLFRHFYIMIVCYIYFTRIVVYLLRITVPFQYEWLDEMFKEMAVFVFFVMTGYKFRPAGNNPYFQLSQEEMDDEEDVVMDRVMTETALTEDVKSRHKSNTGRQPERRAGMIEDVDFDYESDEDDRRRLTNKHESSHEYD